MKQQIALRVDLTTREVSKETVPQDIVDKFMGGRGVGAYYAYKLIKPGIDPLGPENVIVFGAGALSGTTAPCSGRTSVTTKSPLTNMYLKSSSGGHWGAELKYAGYDYVIVTGASSQPVYIWIDDDKVEIRDASKVWGTNTHEAYHLIRQELGDESVQIATIGHAGEKKVLCSCISFSHHHAAGRGAPGAVMGSKNLKAIAVRGTKPITVAEPQAFYEVSQRVRQELAADQMSVGLSLFGTGGIMVLINETHAVANRNFQFNHVDWADKVSGQYLVEKGYLTGRVSCNSCSIGCHRYVKNNQGPFAGVDGSGPEWEALVSLGIGPDVSDTEAVLMANQICNLAGMDVISAGSIVQWAMECFEKGYLTKEDTGGIELTWGNGRALCDVLEMIGKREGKLGELLAKGTKRASEELGGETWKWAVQAKGLEQSCVETRSAKSYALAFAVNPRGPDHLMTETMAEFGGSPEAVAAVKEATGSEEYANAYLTDKRAEIVRWHEDVYGLTEQLGMCVFTSTMAYAVNANNMTEMYNLAMGKNLSVEEALLTARRTVTLERCFNVREGATRADDKLPWRVMNDAVKSGPRKGAVNSEEELKGMLDEYFKLHNWDIETGIPKMETLEELGMDEIACDCVERAQSTAEK